MIENKQLHKFSDKEAPPPIPLRAHKMAQNNRATTSKHNLEGSSTRESNEDLEFNQSQEWKKVPTKNC